MFLFSFIGLILSEPVGALSRPDLVHAGSSSIFEARTAAELSTGLTQAVLAVASSCREMQYVAPTLMPCAIFHSTYYH